MKIDWSAEKRNNNFVKEKERKFPENLFLPTMDLTGTSRNNNINIDKNSIMKIVLKQWLCLGF